MPTTAQVWLPSTLKRERETEFSSTPQTTKSTRRDGEDDSAHESGDADGRGLSPGDEDGGEPSDDHDLLHAHGELHHGQGRAGELGERAS